MLVRLDLWLSRRFTCQLRPGYFARSVATTGGGSRFIQVFERIRHFQNQIEVDFVPVGMHVAKRPIMLCLSNC